MMGRSDRDDSSWRRTGVSGQAYEARLAALERAGHDLHGEADFVQSLGAASVLDAGCGTGRVAIELARRGMRVAGIDRDADMIQTARQKAPTLDWFEQDIASYAIPDSADPAQPRRFDAIVMAGNVMIFLDAGSEARVVANLARHLAPNGKLNRRLSAPTGRLEYGALRRLCRQRRADPRRALGDLGPPALERGQRLCRLGPSVFRLADAPKTPRRSHRGGDRRRLDTRLSRARERRPSRALFGDLFKGAHQSQGDRS